MGNSLLVERIETFIKSVLVPKTIVETVHRGGKVFQRHRRIMVRNWEVGITGKLANGEFVVVKKLPDKYLICLLYTSPSPRDGLLSRMPSSA